MVREVRGLEEPATRGTTAPLLLPCGGAGKVAAVLGSSGDVESGVAHGCGAPFGKHMARPEDHHLENPDEYPGLPRRSGLERVLVLRTTPAFSAKKVWALYRVEPAGSREVEYWVRRIVASGATTGLHHYGADAQLPRPVAESLLAELAAIQIPVLAPSDLLGIDGAGYSVETGNDMASCAVGWWEDPPDPWAPLATWYSNATRVFQGALPAATTDEP